MKNALINKCMNLIRSYNKNYTKKQLDTIKYGLEGLYLTITKLIIIFIVSIVLGIFNEVLCLIVTFNIIRLFSFGVHAKKSSHCMISSLIFFITFPLICKYVTISKELKEILAIPLVILIGIYSPADTEKRPLKDKKKRIIYKILSIIIASIFMILSIKIQNNTLSNNFMFAVIIQIIIILPITYKIFGVSYKNYKKYENNKED